MVDIQVVYTGEDKCLKCFGWGEVDQEGVSRKVWAELPPLVRLAYDMGLVTFTTCAACNGTGREVKT